MVPSPTFAPSTISDAASFLSSHHSDDFSLMSLETYPREEPSSPRSPPVPDDWSSSSPTSPPSSVTPSPSSPPETVRPRTPIDRAIDGLKDLLEDLRGQAQALWDGQLATNRMLDDLFQRRPPIPPDTSDEINNRLRSIEDHLNNLLRNMEPEGSEPSELSSDTASALRRYLERLRVRRQEPPPPLHMPAPIRPLPPSFETDWPSSVLPDQPVQGPPPLIPLVRRSIRPSRVLSPIPSTLSPPLRATSAPPLRFADTMPRPRRPPWLRPPIPRLGRPYPPASPLDAGDHRPEVRTPFTPRPLDDIDFDQRVRDLRRARQPGTDGWYGDMSRPRPQPRPEQEPRVQTAPPPGESSRAWYRPAGRRDEPITTVRLSPILNTKKNVDL